MYWVVCQTSCMAMVTFIGNVKCIAINVNVFTLSGLWLLICGIGLMFKGNLIQASKMKTSTATFVSIITHLQLLDGLPSPPSLWSPHSYSVVCHIYPTIRHPIPPQPIAQTVSMSHNIHSSFIHSTSLPQSSQRSQHMPQDVF